MNARGVLLPLGLVLLPVLAAGAGLSAGEGTAAGVLERRCLSCHNPEKKAGGIDLSTRASAEKAGAVAAAPASSRLLRAVTAGKMPPSGKLPAAEIALLREWVRSGAAYPREPLHAPSPLDRPLWSLQPVKKPAVPKTSFDALAKNPVDRFLFAKLQAKGLKPSPPASRPALLRRVTIDLTGLPPTPEEVAAFVADRSPEAYEKVVDRLLASPAYGERWAQHWLDVVRYGESNGYEQNHLRANAWPYRDYVIRAFNQDRPYPQFILEQLAGDVVGNGNPEVEVATGFLVAGIHDTVGNQTEEGTRQQRANDLDDMVCATAETFLGLTVGCAKCHDHKFDPIPQKDYYRLAAVFAGVRHGERPVGAMPPSPEQQSRAGTIARELREINSALIDLDAEARAAALRAQGVDPVTRPTVSPRRNVEQFAPVRARFVRFTVEATRDGTQPCLDELEVYGIAGKENLALASSGAKPSASSLLPGYPIHQIAHLNDGKYGNDHSWISSEPGRGWVQIELPATVEVSRVVWSRDSGDRARFTDRLPSQYRVEVSEDGKEWKTVATGADRAPSGEAIPGGTLDQARTPEQRERRKDLVARQERLRAEQARLAGPPTAYIGQFGAPDPVYILKRGDVMQRAELVTPGGLSRVPGYGPELVSGGAWDGKPEAERRLAFAKWLGSRENPLTARVLVNRVWHYHFGRGLVPTPSDFGHNGQRPSHPELLDWLASWFMAPSPSSGMDRETAGQRDGGAGRGCLLAVPLSRSLSVSPSGAGWTLKRLHKLIVTSYAYRQTSAPNAKGVAVDAGNQLLWRMPLRRLEAEAVRDAILATSGALDRRMGGPGFQLYKYRVVNVAIYEPREDQGPETWRRGVYHQTARAIRDDLLGTFDCPDSAQRTPRRESTTTALQALSLLNGTFVNQQAGLFAERVRKEAGADPAAQVQRAFRLAFGRSPAADEQAASLDLVRKQGLPALTRALLNANEFLYY